MKKPRKSSSLLSGTGTYVLANIINAAIPFALLPVLTRYLSPADYGRVAMFQTLLTVLAAVGGLGVVGSIARKYYDKQNDPDELRDLIASCLQILFVTSAILSVVVLVVRQRLSAWLEIDAVWIQGAIFVSSALLIVRIRLGQWQVKKQPRAYGAFQISQSLGNVGLSLLLVVVLHYGYHGRIAAQVVVALCFGVVACVLLWRERLLAFWVWKPRLVREALDYGIPLLPHIIGTVSLGTMDRLVVNSELGLTETGLYVVATQLAGGMGIIFDGINKAFVPWLFERLSRDNAAEKARIVRLTYAWYGAVLAVVALAFLIGPMLLGLIAGERYARAGEIIGWLVLGEAFGGMYLMVTNYVYFARRTGLVSVASLTAGVLNIALLILFIRNFGFRGAAWAFAISMGLRFLLTWWAAQRSVPMPWFSAFGKKP